MKTILFIFIGIFGLSISTSAQSIEDLFVKAPDTVVNVSGEERRQLIETSTPTHLTLKLNEQTSGEFKIVSQKKDEFIVGLIWKNCDQSDITFWQIKKGVWKDTTKAMLAPLGKKDVINILAASPATIEKLSDKVEISFFYTFAANDLGLQLIARKQGTCEVAGKVYDYRFNGKKFIIVNR